ncbi:MAG: helix-turn-helix transcriptional regulator [Acidobacteriota bacterium]
MNVTERINRVLFIMSYVSQNQGVQVKELAGKVGMHPDQLMKELDFILLIGKPPFQPDDYVDIYVEEDRVYIEFDQMLNRPLRFTHPEAMALFMSLQLLDPEVDPETVSSLQRKIEKAISESVDPPSYLEDRIIFERASSPVSRHFTLLRRAIEDNQKVNLDYYSLTRNETGRRTVRPYFLTKSLGYWYLTGYCELRQDLRTFKFERILSVRVLDEAFAAPQDLDVARYKKNFLRLMGKHRVAILFDSTVAPWIREKWGTSVTDAPEGAVILKLSSETLEFPSRLVLSYAPHARPIKPLALIQKVRRDAREALQMYEPKPVS